MSLLRSVFPELRQAARLPYYRTRIPSLFDDPFFRDPFSSAWQADQSMPLMDVKENEKEFTIEAEVPGIPKDNLDIQIVGDSTLVLSSSSPAIQESKEQKENYVSVERSLSAFRREFNLGTKVDPDKIQASLKDGILTVVVPKEEVSARKIQIQG